MKYTIFFRLIAILLATALTFAWSNRQALAAGEELRGELFGWGPGASLSSSLGGTFIYSSGPMTAASDTTSEFKFYKSDGGGQWFGTGGALAFGQISSGFNTENGNASFNHVQNKYYVAKWNGASNGVVFQLSGAAVGISAVSRTLFTPVSSDTVTINANTNATPPAEQAVWLRYALNGNWAGSSLIKLTGSGTSYTASIPAQRAGTQVAYYVFTSGNVASIAAADADLMTMNADTNGGSNYSYTVGIAPTPITAIGSKALWLDGATIAWNGVAGATYKLLYDPDGGLNSATENAAYTNATNPGFLMLITSGTVNGASYPKNPNANGLVKLSLPAGTPSGQIKNLLRGQVVIASYSAGNVRLDATNVQVQGVLDNVYVDNGTAARAALGVSYAAGVPTARVWAPTAKSVTLRRFANGTTPTFTTHTMTLDVASGVWSVTGATNWNRQYFLFDVQVYVPALDVLVNNLVTDPYAMTLSTDTSNTADPRSQFVNLSDADLKPAGWDSLIKPALAAPEDSVIYEMHVRDFSINDSTVLTAERGTYMAFTYDGTGPDANTAQSDGMAHVLALKNAGLTHVHLLPVFDIASVPENSVPRTVSPNPTGFARNAQNQQSIVNGARASDGFNWGYDPYHYGAPEGSYSTNPEGVQRILEFRRMVSALNQNGLRVVMDVVYNHLAAKGQEDKSVLDKIVPGYYLRYDTTGALYQTSCCADTASEYAMLEKLMLDTLKRWASDYKVDGFRFDLMNFHTRQNMLNVKSALQAIDPTIYVYGEGWDFGSAQNKGLTNCPNCYAKQSTMSGAGIGLFNDRIRDAAHGGYSGDPLQVRKQGFTNGLHYDWNGYCYTNRAKSDLDAATDVLRSAMRASGADWNGQGNPFTDDPSESVPYIEKHDNETLFDQNIFKLANGAGDPGACGSSYGPPTTPMTERVRSQNVGQALIGLAQGVPFFHMGTDLLRSKSLDRNSYDSSDWFNRVFWNKRSNNFGQGLPLAADNSSRWGIMAPLLSTVALDPATTDIAFSAAQFREVLRLRKSSPLFRLRTEADVNARVTFFNTGNNPDGLLVMGLDDGALATDLDANYEYILVLVNANKVAQAFVVPGAAGMGFGLHPVQADGVDADAVVQTSSFNNSTGQFNIPARSFAVFVSSQPLVPPSTIDFVGLMFPLGGVANPINQNAFAQDSFDVYVQVYEPSLTEAAGANTDIQCFLNWGLYGTTWRDVAMTWHKQQNNNDEYRVALSKAVINGLKPGSYGFNAYCKKTGESAKQWKQDGSDDQGDGLLTIVPSADSSAERAGAVFVHLFEWRWADIEKECAFLAQKGYWAVQVSPPMEHVPPTANMGGSDNDYPWWVRYQPVTHDTAKFTSRSGTLAEFERMVQTCNTLGVGVIVDAVINHTTGVGSGTGTAGSAYTPYTYPQYTPDDFHVCGTTDNDIRSYKDRAQVQNCELVNLADLNTGRPTVQATLRGYLQSLLKLGVAGFRIDAAKHMAAKDVAVILAGLRRLDGSKPYVFMEVIDQGGEPIKSLEYAPHGDVTEFRYSVGVGSIFNGCGGKLSDLQTLTKDFLPSRFAVVFTDNHDNQRGHGAGGSCVLDHRDGNALYNLGNVFQLAFPYGHPAIMSSYYWSNNPASNAGDSKGPPSTTAPFTAGSGANTRPVYGPGQEAGAAPINCATEYEDGKWVCEHRRTAIANMVRFRLATAGEPVSNWQNIGGSQTNHIAFGRGAKGFVALNRTDKATTTTYQTSLPAGNYCDVTKYDFVSGKCVLPGTTNAAPASGLVVVNASGQIVSRALGAMDAFAVYVGAKN